MAKKVLYFTAGDVPTPQETAEMAAIKATTATAFTFGARSRIQSQAFGAGPEECDFVAGTPPSGLPWSGKPVFNPAAPPRPDTMLPIQTVVTSGQAVTGVTLTGTAGAGKTMTLTIVAGVVTAAAFV